MSYVCLVQNSLQSVNTGEDTLALSGDTAPGGGGQSRRVLLVEAGPVHPCDGPARVQGQARCIKITGKIVISVMWNVESFTRQQRVILRQFLHVARNNLCLKQMDKYNSIPDIQRFGGGGGQRINKLVPILSKWIIIYRRSKKTGWFLEMEAFSLAPNISAESLSNLKARVSIGILRTSWFWNCPCMLDSNKN